MADLPIKDADPITSINDDDSLLVTGPTRDGKSLIGYVIDKVIAVMNAKPTGTPIAGKYVPYFDGGALKRADFASFGGGGGSANLDGFPAHLTGKYWNPFEYGGPTVGGSAPGLNTARFIPFRIVTQEDIAAIRMRVGTLFAGGNVQYAICENDPGTMQPLKAASPIVSTASQSTAATGAFDQPAVCTLDPGIYWLGVNADNATVVMACLATGFPQYHKLVGGDSGNALDATYTAPHLSCALTFGSWNLTAVTFAEAENNNAPFVMFKAG